jgi:glucokinase
MGKYIGIDLGGTKIAGAVLEAGANTVICDHHIPTEAPLGPDAVIERIASLVRTLCAKASVDMDDVAAVGLGAAGVTDNAKGLIVLVANLPGDWHNRPVAAQLRAHVARPVHLLNDAHAFTLAEANLGAGRGAESVACFTLGTGIGGGFAINGHVYLGHAGAAGIFGHQTIEPNGLQCGCGNRGCLETLISGPAITTQALRAVVHGANTILGSLVDNDLNRLHPGIILQAAELGDTVARAIIEQAGHYLGLGIANVMSILSPHCVVIGGGVSQLGDWLLEPARQTLKARCFTAPVDRTPIVQATLGGQAASIGAAIWAAQCETASSVR